jgi:D-alanyl-D-alanine carboxypeptidase/D-alanyl-D-alanine-endopeptidase (penicillin-binding protein 4)
MPCVNAAEEVPANLIEMIARVTSQPRYRRSTWGFSVADLATGEVLYEQNADKMFVPGSIMKNYSTATALEAYGPDHRFRTPVYRDGPVTGWGVLRGNLVLVAAGDFSFGLREQPDGTLAFNSLPEADHNYANNLPGAVILKGNPLAALNELAAAVRASGIRVVRGDVVIDERLFRPFRDWPDGVISPIWVNENVIDLLVTPRSVGERAKVTTRPETSAYKIDAEVATVEAGQPTDIQLDSPAPGMLRLRGQIAAGSQPELRIWQVEDPAAFARTTFIEALRRAGVIVRASADGPNPVDLLPSADSYRPSERIGEHVSAPLSEFTKVVLKVSYNRGAQLMTCLAAAGAGSRDCEQGLVRQFETSRRLGVSADGTFAFDGAGSEEQDRTTPADMTTFLRGVARQPYGAAFRAGLPILGVDGTLATTQKGTPAAGRVQAKTGTRGGGLPTDQFLLTGQTMAGYAEAKSGRQLVLVIMVRDVPATSLEELLSVADDQGEILVAMQQGY